MAYFPIIPDYIRGSFKRVFSVQRTNPRYFYESTGNIPSLDSWKNYTIDWQLTGPLVAQGSVNGILENNSNKILTLSQDIPDIAKILKNPYTYTILWPFLDTQLLNELADRRIITARQRDLIIERNSRIVRQNSEERIFNPLFRFKTA